MRRLVLVLASLAVLSLAVHSQANRRAYACSAGPDYDPVAESDVIVEGRFLGWEILADQQPQSIYSTVEVEMSVERVHKGDVVGNVVSLVDSRSLVRQGEESYVWSGAGGSCGAFDFDPTGKYAVTGLSQREDGTYVPGRLRTFFIGEGPAGEGYEHALERMASFPGAADLPSLGSGPSGSGESPAAAVVAALVATGVGVAFLGGFAASKLRTWR